MTNTTELADQMIAGELVRFDDSLLTEITSVVESHGYHVVLRDAWQGKILAEAIDDLEYDRQNRVRETLLGLIRLGRECNNDSQKRYN